jgi:tetratricopeptide (TPR) repeat protein
MLYFSHSFFLFLVSMLLSPHRLISKYIGKSFVLLLLLLYGNILPAQTGFLVKAPPEKRLPVFWQYCDEHFISDQDSTVTYQFLTEVANTADSLGDHQLKSYALYFRKCYHILFTHGYEQYFPPGDHSIFTILDKTKAWAEKEGYADIVASCDHFTGQVYFRENHYGPAFEYLLRADEAFKKIGYQNVPYAAGYLYELGSAYYRFEEWDKALEAFIAASHYPFYISRDEINNYNVIGLIYARKKKWDKATLFYRIAIAKAAACRDTTWVGIASGSLGAVFLQKGQNDSALFYYRINYHINSKVNSVAPEDAARTALAMADAYIRKQQRDSALYYIHSAEELARINTKEVTDVLEFRKRYFAVLIALHKAKKDYQSVSAFSDSLITVKDSLQQILDDKILSRATEKADAERYAAGMQLLETEEELSRLRAYMVITVLLSIIVIGGLLFNRFWMRKQREAKLAEKEKQLISVEKMRAEESLKHAEELLTGYLTTIKEKTNLIENLDAELEHLKQVNYPVNTFKGMAANMDALVSSTILTEEDWRHFRTLFEQVYPGFLYRLKERFSDLSPAEIRLLILTRLKLSSREMAHMLGITIEAIRKNRYRVRKKLNLDEESKLEELILQV